MFLHVFNKLCHRVVVQVIQVKIRSRRRTVTRLNRPRCSWCCYKVSPYAVRRGDVPDSEAGLLQKISQGRVKSKRASLSSTELSCTVRAAWLVDRPARFSFSRRFSSLSLMRFPCIQSLALSNVVKFAMATLVLHMYREVPLIVTGMNGSQV